MGTAIAIVDFEAGNLASVKRAVEYLGREAEITQDATVIRQAERVIFPGVGAAGATMANLLSMGLAEVIVTGVFRAGKPMLGICIGIQIVFDSSEEDDAECLGMLSGKVKRFPGGVGMKVPQIGWNQVWQCKSHPVFEGIVDGAEFYFVNSYYPVPDAEDVVFATTDYGVKFASVVAHENLVATQFHLEKSGPAGLRMLDNFCRWDGNT